MQTPKQGAGDADGRARNSAPQTSVVLPYLHGGSFSRCADARLAGSDSGPKHVAFFSTLIHRSGTFCACAIVQPHFKREGPPDHGASGSNFITHLLHSIPTRRSSTRNPSSASARRRPDRTARNLVPSVLERRGRVKAIPGRRSHRCGASSGRGRCRRTGRDSWCQAIAFSL